MPYPFDLNPILLVCIIICSWVLGSFAISLMSGWYLLSRKYSRQHVTNGHLFSFATIFFGIIGYRRAVFIRVGDEGLDISTFVFLRFSHPPLLIPWSAFDSCKRTQFVFSNILQLTLKGSKWPLFVGAGQLANEIEKCYRQQPVDK
jgi:hypothetical protein